MKIENLHFRSIDDHDDSSADRGQKAGQDDQPRLMPSMLT
jgi:hypothetical protein